MAQKRTIIPGKPVKRILRMPARKLTNEQLKVVKEQREKRARCLQLRADGLTYREIADVMGYKSASAAQYQVTKGLEEVVLEPAKELIIIDLVRLDEFQKRLTAKMRKGDDSVITTLMAIMRERRVLLGWSPESWSEEQRKGEGITNNGVMVIQGDSTSFVRGMMEAVGIDPNSEEAKKRLEIVRAQEEKEGTGEYALTGPKPNELLMAAASSALNENNGIIKGEVVRSELVEVEIDEE